jgi:hypothetical protein
MADKVAVEAVDGKHRVAYDLMQEIARHEEVDSKAPRRYWMELYAQCLKVVNGRGLPGGISERPSEDEDYD